jgi:hypothetical protein
MKLTSAQVERTLSLFEDEVIPDDHPAILPAKVVNLANWSHGNPNSLKLHEPKPTNVVVTLGTQH